MSREQLEELEKNLAKTLEPHHKQLGALLQSWNSLQFQLTYLFLRICETRDGEPLPQDILLAIWNAVPNDRLQREMLRRAATVRFGRHEKTMLELGLDVAPIRQNEQKMLGEILWILESADGLGRQRDDAAHVPTVVSIPFTEDLADAVLEIRPLDALEHPIAKRLVGQNLLEFFDLQRRRIDAVSDYARAWDHYLGGLGDWPKRPLWPARPK